jgi:micrococcal nuclease
MYEYRAKITAVYDGDTVTADIDLGFEVWLRGQRLRLLNIDTPEVRGKEKKEGIVSRDALRDRILGKEVIVMSDRRGKYGRWLVEIFLDEENINSWLLNEGYAIPYI